MNFSSLLILKIRVVSNCMRCFSRRHVVYKMRQYYKKIIKSLIWVSKGHIADRWPSLSYGCRFPWRDVQVVSNQVFCVNSFFIIAKVLCSSLSNKFLFCISLPKFKTKNKKTTSQYLCSQFFFFFFSVHLIRLVILVNDT